VPKVKNVELPRHCPLVLSIEIGGRDGKAFRIEEGTMECFELCNPGSNLNTVFTVLELNFDDEDVGRAA
jgi:activator of 2-hydroxyglutaryl-CoA dehydratase